MNVIIILKEIMNEKNCVSMFFNIVPFMCDKIRDKIEAKKLFITPTYRCRPPTVIIDTSTTLTVHVTDCDNACTV